MLNNAIKFFTCGNNVGSAASIYLSFSSLATHAWHHIMYFRTQEKHGSNNSTSAFPVHNNKHSSNCKSPQCIYELNIYMIMIYIYDMYTYHIYIYHSKYEIRYDSPSYLQVLVLQ